MSDVDCTPIGVSIPSTDHPRTKLYKHFDCSFNITYADFSYETFERILHVTGAQSFVFSTP